METSLSHELAELKQTLSVLNARLDRLDIEDVIDDTELGQLKKYRDHLQEFVHKAKETLGDTKEQLGRHGKDVDGYVRSHPWESAAIALGVGALAALLLSHGDR
jgi:ElaB/YqjD/DUF883 family membrane-anchored ribosome-binding protein